MSGKLCERALKFIRIPVRYKRESRALKLETDEIAVSEPDYRIKLKRLIELSVNGTNYERKDIKALFTSLHGLENHDALTSVAPVAPSMLSHFSHSTSAEDHLFIASACSILLDRLRARGRQCICRNENLLMVSTWNLCCKQHTYHLPASRRNCNVYDGTLARKLVMHFQIALARLGRPNEALMVAEQYDKLDIVARPHLHQEHVSNAIMAAFITKNEPSEALKVYAQKNNKLYRSPRAANLALFAHLQLGDLNAATKLFKTLPHDIVSATHANTIMKALVDAEAYREALSVFHDMCEASKNDPEAPLHPDTISSSIILDCHLRMKNIEEAVHFFHNRFRFTDATLAMRASYTPTASGEPCNTRTSLPTAITYRTLIAGICAASGGDEKAAITASLYHDEMLLGEKIYEPNATCDLLSYCMKINRQDLARHVFECLLRAGGCPNGRTVHLANSLYPQQDMAALLSSTLR